jgi:hypothetical protein
MNTQAQAGTSTQAQAQAQTRTGRKTQAQAQAHANRGSACHCRTFSLAHALAIPTALAFAHALAIPTALALALALAFPASVHAQRPTLTPQVQQYLAFDESVVALTNVRVIDGTGAPARAGQTVLIRDGVIAAVGVAGDVAVPADAHVLDLAGRSVVPGLVMVHEHLYYPTGPGVYAFLAESFTRLYLAGGVTSLRTGGNMNGYGELAIGRAIAEGRKPGPWIDATAPYLEGPGTGFAQLYALGDADDARRMVNFWADAGATSFKAYMNITRDMLGAGIAEAHRAEGDRPSLLGHVPRSRRARH